MSRRAADPPPSPQEEVFLFPEVVGVFICVEDGYESYHDHDPYLRFFPEITSVFMRSAHMKSI